MNEMAFPKVEPAEGMAVLHLFYQINRQAWQEIDAPGQVEAKSRLTQVLEDFESATGEKAEGGGGKSAFSFAMLGKADLGFMLLSPEVHRLNQVEKQIRWALGPEVLEPEFTYLSLTEKSEYTTTEDQYRAQVMDEEGLAAGSPELEQKMQEFRQRIEKYTRYRLYPEMPSWEYFCFYPMSKRRAPGQNWYALEFEQRKALMGGHARVGRRYADRIKQLVTGSTGLDDWEWGVTLFAHDPCAIKEIVYEMRFDEVSHQFAEFGPFYNGLTLSLPQIYSRLML